MKTFDLSVHRERPTVMSQFPLVFGRGGRWLSFEGSCTSCHAVLPPDEIRGVVKAARVHAASFRDEGGDAYAFHVDALGYCDSCNLLTPFRMVMTDDMRMATFDGGYMNIFEPRRSLWPRLKSRIRQLFSATRTS